MTARLRCVATSPARRAPRSHWWTRRAKLLLLARDLSRKPRTYDTGNRRENLAARSRWENWPIAFEQAANWSMWLVNFRQVISKRFPTRWTQNWNQEVLGSPRRGPGYAFSWTATSSRLIHGGQWDDVFPTIHLRGDKSPPPDINSVRKSLHFTRLN